VLPQVLASVSKAQFLTDIVAMKIDGAGAT
jgi:hypothetical protein